MIRSFKILAMLLLFFLMPVRIFAQSSYVLPYPSNMPGSIFYNLGLFREFMMKYWYFGDFGKFYYNLRLSDKYLVESKTLFEYKQYLLGYNALKKSDKYFSNIAPSLKQARNHQKNINEKRELLNQASLKHIEILTLMLKDNPEIFDWKPEGELPIRLDVKRAILESVSLRGCDL